MISIQYSASEAIQGRVLLFLMQLFTEKSICEMWATLFYPIGRKKKADSSVWFPVTDLTPRSQGISPVQRLCEMQMPLALRINLIQ